MRFGFAGKGVEKVTDREELIELMIRAKREDPEKVPFSEFLADFLLANGVTIVTDTNVGSKWISMAERKPEDDLPPNSKKKQIKVLTAIKGENGYTIRSQMRNYYISRPEIWTWKYSAGEVTHWMPMPEGPTMNKED